jgi:nucleotide-binding universal stress UspA family protein
MTRTLLLAAQSEDSDRQAVELAVDLAAVLDARVVLGAVLVPSGTDDDIARQRLADQLDALQSSIPSDIASEKRSVDAVSVGAGLHQLAEDLDAELLVLGARQRGGILPTLRDHTAADLAAHGGWGVAVAHEERADGPPRRVGVAWDQTPAANAALEWAIQLVERTRGELHILRVFDPSHREGTKPWEHDEVRLASAEEEASLRVNAEAKVLWGDAAPELIKASRELDLLVAGASGLGAVRRLFGSVANRLVHDANCSVAVVPADIHHERGE